MSRSITAGALVGTAILSLICGGCGPTSPALPAKLQSTAQKKFVINGLALASAATTDLGTAAAKNVSITGTTAIKGFGSTAPVGSTYKVTFAGAAPVLGSATLGLSTATNILWPAVGDTMTCSVSATVGSWTCGAMASSVERSGDGQWVNLTPSALIHWRAKLAAVRAKTGRARIVFITDSTGLGTGAGTGGISNLNGAEPYSFVHAFATRGGTTNTPINYNSVSGDQCVTTSAGVSYTTYDPRVTVGAGWAANVRAPTLGGSHLFTFTSGKASNFTFTPTAAFNTITMRTVTNGSTPTATVNVDGGASLGTLTQTGANANKTTTYTVSLGTHTINVVPDNTGTFFLGGIETSNSAVPAVDVTVGGCWGGKVSGAIVTTSAPWSPLPMLAYLAPDLTVIDLTINDNNNSTALASYLAGIQALVTQAKLSGDVVLMAGVPSSAAASANNTNGFLDTYIAGLADLARSNNVVLMNTKARWTSYAVSNAVMPYFDNFHPGKLGYEDLGQWLTGLLGP